MEKRLKKARHIGLIITLLIVVLIGIVILRTQWVEQYLAHKLIERTSQESDGFYNLSYKKLSLSIWNGELKLHGVSLKPDSTVFHDWQTKDSLPNTYMELSIDLIHFKGLNLTWRHNFKKLHFKSFIIKTPDIKIFQTNDLPHQKKKPIHASSKNLYQMVSKYIAELSVNELNLDNASILFSALNPQSPIIYSIQNVSFDAYGFLMNEESYENGKLLFCDNFKFTTHQSQKLITNNDFILNTDSISLNTADSLVYISNIELISTKGNPGYPENKIDASVKTIYIDGIDFTRHNTRNDLAIRSFNVIDPQIKTSHIATFGNHNESQIDTLHQPHNLLTTPLSIYDIISPIFVQLTIDEINIDKAKMNYTLYTKHGIDLFDMNSFTFKAYHIIVDSIATSNNRYLFSQNFVFDIEGLSGEMKDNNQLITIDKMWFNSLKGDLTIENASIKPITTKTNKDYLKGSVNLIQIMGLDYQRGIEASSFIIEQPNFVYTLASATPKSETYSENKNKKKGDIFDKLFSDYLTHLSLNEFKLNKGNFIVCDGNLKYQLKNLDFFANNLLLRNNSKNSKGYTFNYKKIGFSFHDFDNYLPGRNYRLQINNGSYSTLSNLLLLKNIHLMPQDSLLKNSKSALWFQSPQLSISGVDYKEISGNKEASFVKLQLDSPKVNMITNEQETYCAQLSSIAIDTLVWSNALCHIGNIELLYPLINIKTTTRQQTMTDSIKVPFKGLPSIQLPKILFEKASNIAPELSMNTLDIRDALINYTIQKPDTTTHVKLDTTNLAIKNLYINNTSEQLSFQPYFSTINITYPLDKGMFNIGAKKLELINDTLLVEKMSYTSPYSKMEFSYVDPKHKSWFDVTIDQIGLYGIDYNDLLTSNKLKLKSMSIDNIMFQNFVNQKTKLPRHKWFPMIYSYLQKAPVAIDIPIINVNHFDVVYEELSRKGSVIGKLTLDDLTGNITNVTNILPTDNPYMIASLHGKLMGKGNFDIEWQIPIDSLNDHFTLKANVGEFDLRELNPLVTPLAPIEIKNGKLHQMTFHADASSIQAKSDMLLRYDSLYAEIIDYKDSTLHEHPFVSKIANRLIRHKNEDQHALTEIKRNAYHPTFNYIWQIMEPALVESVGFDMKEQEKVVKAVGFFDKIIHFFKPKKKIKPFNYPELILQEN